jgi:hypothetical protein
MKLKLTLVLLISVALFYSACKKSSTTTTQKALSPQAVSSQIALNLSQTLFGGLGTFNIGGGLDAPGEFGVIKHNKLHINDVNGDPACGTIVDTTLNSSVTIDTAQLSVKGTIKFSFLCSNGSLSGYNINENVQIGAITPHLAISYSVAEALTIQSTDPTSSLSTLSLNGTLNEAIGIKYKTGSNQTDNDSFNYVFKSVIIDPNTDGLTSGTATFVTKGSGPTGSWNYTGTITFLPNYRAQITINGSTYLVDLQTGQLV